MSSRKTLACWRFSSSCWKKNVLLKRSEPEKKMPCSHHPSPLKMTCSIMWTQSRSNKGEWWFQDNSRNESWASHSGEMCDHFSEWRTSITLMYQWWWDGMHTDMLHFVRNFPSMCESVQKWEGHTPSIASYSACGGSKLPFMVPSGIVIYMLYCGHTTTLPIRQLVRNHPFFFLAPCVWLPDSIWGSPATSMSSQSGNNRWLQRACHVGTVFDMQVVCPVDQVSSREVQKLSTITILPCPTQCVWLGPCELY